MTDTRPDASRLNILQSLSGYSAHFMDVDLWMPFIRAVCAESGITCGCIRPGDAGTFPVFVLDDRYVIKFFGPLFDGASSALVETAVDSSLAAQPDLPAARVLFRGQVPAESNWQYLIYTFIPGRSFREDRSRTRPENQLHIARRLGVLMRRFHSLPIPSQPADTFSTELSMYRDRLRGWFSSRLRSISGPLYARLGLPAHLAVQAEGYLARCAHLSLRDPLHLIHADLTADHVLGEFHNGEWRINGLIDMGDCMTGDLFYELAALYLDCFDADKALLFAFLDGYGTPEYLQPDFPQRCLCAALQHQFNVFSTLFESQPALAQALDLDHLAHRVWGHSSLLSYPSS